MSKMYKKKFNQKKKFTGRHFNILQLCKVLIKFTQREGIKTKVQIMQKKCSASEDYLGDPV